MITHKFPLMYIHEGTTLGNGILGLSVWGRANRIKISIGSSILWDHRGGMVWRQEHSFTQICQALKEKNTEKLYALFDVDAPLEKNTPPRPSLTPLGRIEITLPKLAELDRAELDLSCGMVRVVYKYKKIEKKFRLLLSQHEKGSFSFIGDDAYAVRLLSAYELGDALKSVGFTPPEKFKNGFVQTMSSDPSFRLEGMAAKNNEWNFAFSREHKSIFLSFKKLLAENKKYWGAFWKKVPEITCPEAPIGELYQLGLFKFQSMTASDGYPAGLQGPWIEDDAFPAWSGDYHFNINVEMCYWPAFHSGLWENLMRNRPVSYMSEAFPVS